jgi:hypothetical protein
VNYNKISFQNNKTFKNKIILCANNQNIQQNINISKRANEIVNHFQLKCEQVLIENYLVLPRVFNFVI